MGIGADGARSGHVCDPFGRLENKTSPYAAAVAEEGLMMSCSGDVAYPLTDDQPVLSSHLTALSTTSLFRTLQHGLNQGLSFTT